MKPEKKEAAPVDNSGTASLEDYYTCHVCLQVADDAVETECCHHVFCEHCIAAWYVTHKECPLCRKHMFTWTVSTFLRQVIADKPMVCPFGCGKGFPRSELKSHTDLCESREFICTLGDCKFKSKRADFLAHIFSQHDGVVLDRFDRSKYKPQEPVAEAAAPAVNLANEYKFKKGLNLCAGVMNSAGHLARLGSTGKFYCGEHVDGKCGCCDGTCGPTNGCNCVACMRLDIAIRSLPKGYLVNKCGRIAKYVPESGLFYCNCDPEGGSRCSVVDPCYACIALKTGKAIYQTLI